ncbi:ribosomal-processing cysteine protease Prp [Bacillaceae bacterium S4-13-58]
MIRVKIRRNEQKIITAFEISGHAESGPKGHDLVCAAVSAISFGTINAVLSLCEIDPEIQQGGEGGYLRIELPSTMELWQKEKASTILDAMVISLETIERDYGQYISIS